MDVVKDIIYCLFVYLIALYGLPIHLFPTFLFFFPFSHQGDNVDRGAGTIDVYKLLQKLRGQASAAGGAVSILFPVSSHSH